MEQEDIELLFKEFSGRLHYGLIVSPVDCGKARLIGCLLDSVLLQDIRTGKYYDKPWDIEYVKPYLRPMSSMTKEEINEFEQITDNLLDNGTSEEIWNTVIDWLNAHHFDHRGLIGKGLAIEAPNDMYKT